MKDLILQTVKQFLRRHYTPGRALVLGCSGGSDSLALFHLLCALLSEFSIQLHVAHVDHNWREESGIQARELLEHVDSKGIPYHQKVIQKGVASSEEAARQERLTFFSLLVKELDAQALLLGHHADDQAETVLKRVLEGASLGALGGMNAITSYREMVIWRPLLTLSKKEMISWSEKKGLQPFIDPTNSDPKYLRARMRHHILPDLEKSFGKSVSANLVRLGQLADEMQQYLEKKSALFKIEPVREGERVSLDFTPYYPLDSLELKFFLKYFFNKEKRPISFRSLNTIQELLEKRVECKIIDSILVKNGSIFLVKNN